MGPRGKATQGKGQARRRKGRARMTRQGGGARADGLVGGWWLFFIVFYGFYCFVLFFIGFLSIIPFALVFEKKKIISQINVNKKLFYQLLFWISVFLFLGTYFQQTALLYTDVANAAFFTVFYVPMVPIILFVFYSK